MREISINLNEISDSRELMESKPYPVIMYFIYLMLSLFSIALMWSFFSEIELASKGRGVVRPNHQVSVVNAPKSGYVEKSYLEEGRTVNKGDLLYVIQHDDLLATQERLNKEVDKLEIKIKNDHIYLESVLNKENLFDPKNPEQEKYYYAFSDFFNERRQAAEKINLKQSQLSEQESKLFRNQRLIQAIESGHEEVEIGESDRMYYKAYKLKKKELQLTYEETALQYENSQKLFEAGAISKNDLEKSKLSWENAQLASAQFKNNYVSGLYKENEDINLEVIALQSEIESNGYHINQLNQVHLPTETKAIYNVNQTIEDSEKELRSIEEQLKKVVLGIKKCNIVSEVMGTVHIKSPVSKGDFVTVGLEIATVIPGDNTIYKVDIMMPEKDISGVKVGDRIKYQFDALTYREYGEVDGMVTRIGSDSRVDSSTGQSYFMVEANVKNLTLKSYKGEIANIKVGMTCEARVISKTKRMLWFLLEKIDLWD